MKSVLAKPDRNFRWVIGVLVAFSVIISYIDRTNISIAGSGMARYFGWSNTQLGFLFSAFFWTYALTQIPIGIILDKLGIKWISRIGMSIWSLATIGTGFMNGFLGIAIMRMLLGIAEAPQLPASSKATAFWFPLKERALATSLFMGGANFSGVIATSICVWAMLHWGWRGAFVVTGIINVVFTIVFWVLYRDPGEHPRLTSEEREYIERDAAPNTQAEGSLFGNFLLLLRNRKVLGLTIGYMSFGYTFYVIVTWMPTYLITQLHMSLAKGGMYTIIPYAFATVLEIIIGGWLVDQLIKKGFSSSKVRKFFLIVGLSFGVIILLIPTTGNPDIQIIFLSLAFAGLALTSTTSWSLPSIIAPDGLIGSVGSIMNFFTQLMGVLAPILTGYIVDKTGSFNFGFVLAGIVLLIGIMAYSFLMGDISQIEITEDKEVTSITLPNG